MNYEQSHEELQAMIFEHMKKLSMKSASESFDVQFSDDWL